MQSRTPPVPPKILPVINDDGLRPLYSVMIPTYNCFPFIREALESVLSQDLGAELMQIEVVDDCSTDGDVEKLVQEIGKGRVAFYKKDCNEGSLRNFETCINRAKGLLVHLLHGDDKVQTGFYQKINELYQKYPEAGAYVTNFFYINSAGAKLNLIYDSIAESDGIVPDLLNKLAHRQRIQPPAIIVKREVYEHLGAFYGVHYGEDWEMWARIASNYKVAFTPEFLAAYRVDHGIGISSEYFISGKNIPDIKKVIEIIQNYLPFNERRRKRNAATRYYAVYSIKLANAYMLRNKDVAFKQVKGAWSLKKDFVILFWIIRFYAMYFLGYKKIIHYFQGNNDAVEINNYPHL